MCKVIKTWVDEKGKAWEQVEEVCPRCGGAGLFFVATHNGHGVPAQPDAGVCYKCYGSKKIVVDRRVLTEKEIQYRENSKANKQAKAEAERLQRKLEWEQARPQRILESKQREGFMDDTMYIVIGDSFSIKEQIKADGGRWNGTISKWTFSEAKEGYTLQMVKFDDVARIEGDHEVVFNREAVKDAIATAESSGNLNQYVGVVGDKIQVEVTIKRKFWYDTQWGSNCIILMGDKEGHEYKWNSSNGIDALTGEIITIKGSIKAHEEYNGTKQTVLTRCKEVK